MANITNILSDSTFVQSVTSSNFTSYFTKKYRSLLYVNDPTQSYFFYDSTLGSWIYGIENTGITYYYVYVRPSISELVFVFIYFISVVNCSVQISYVLF